MLVTCQSHDLCLLQLTAKRERARKNQLDIFVGIVRGLRLDFRLVYLEMDMQAVLSALLQCKWTLNLFHLRILMEVLNTEVKSLLSIKDETSSSPLKCIARFIDLMAILDDVQYNCSGGKTLSGPTHVP